MLWYWACPANTNEHQRTWANASERKRFPADLPGCLAAGPAWLPGCLAAGPALLPGCLTDLDGFADFDDFDSFADLDDFDNLTDFDDFADVEEFDYFTQMRLECRNTLIVLNLLPGRFDCGFR